jgi:hypothetical protein
MAWARWYTRRQQRDLPPGFQPLVQAPAEIRSVAEQCTLLLQAGAVHL